LAYEEKIRVLKRDLEMTSNELKFTETEKARVESEKEVLQDKLNKEVARHKEWLISGNKLASLLYSSQSVTSELGLGFQKYVGAEVHHNLDKKSRNNPEPVKFLKEGEMHAVPGPIRGVFMPTTSTSDFDGSHHLYGKKSNDLPKPVCKTNNSDSPNTIEIPKPTSHHLDLNESQIQTGTRTNDFRDSSSVSSNDSNECVSCSFRNMTPETSTSSYMMRRKVYRF
jgi:hypothetical protein